jgi:hypothetical protein
MKLLKASPVRYVEIKKDLSPRALPAGRNNEADEEFYDSIKVHRDGLRGYSCWNTAPAGMTNWPSSATGAVLKLPHSRYLAASETIYCFNDFRKKTQKKIGHPG